MATLDERRAEVLSGANSSPPLEPPYGSETNTQDHLRREGLVREAVEEVLAENESLRRRVSEMEFSSVVSSSSRGRRAVSSGTRSMEMRAMEPDYDRMFVEQPAQALSHGEGRRPQGDVTSVGHTAPAMTMRGIMERAGSLERWQALRSFLGFSVREDSAAREDRVSGGSSILGQNQNAGTTLNPDRTSRELFAEPPGQDQQVTSDRPQRMPWIRNASTNAGPLLRPDPVPVVMPTVSRSEGRVARDESSLGQGISNMVYPEVHRTVDPVFEWFTNVTASTPQPQSKAGLAVPHNSPPGLAPLPGSFRSSVRHPPCPDGFHGSSVHEVVGDVRRIGEAGTGSVQLGLLPQREVRTQEMAEIYQPLVSQPPRLIGSTEQGPPDRPRSVVAGSLGGFSAPCLLDASPPQGVGFEYGRSMGLPAQSANSGNALASSSEAKGTLELLRDLNVSNIGLRGVRLATQGRDQEIVPVVHMPDREAEVGSISGPPPSLDLLGLDPVVTVRHEGSLGTDKPFWGPNPLTPGATTPFSPLTDPSQWTEVPPPPPLAAYESPRESTRPLAAAYTPGGTRVPDGPPPDTPGKQVTFSPAVYCNNMGVQPGLAQAAVPPAPPIPPHSPVATYAPSMGPQRMEEPSKLVYHLPQLQAEPGTQDASVAAGDWIARIRPVLTTLSPSAGLWWQETHKTAFAYYQRWLIGEPSERLSVRSEVEAHRSEWGHLTLINERGAVLILGALTTDLQTECVTTRMLTAVGLLFTILVRYQPGGPAEKAAVLSFLSNPASPANLGDSQASLRRWLRLYNRTSELQLHYPDPSLLMKGLDRLSHLIAKSGHASFRLSSYRHAQRLDYEPTQKSVLAYAQVLLGEVEQQLLGQDQAQVEKRARISKAQVGQEDGLLETPEPKARPKALPPKAGVPVAKPKPKGKGTEDIDPEKDQAPPLCRFFESPSGCRYGKSCRQFHPEIRKGAGRCYECGATSHLRPSCPRKDGPEETPPKRNQRGRRPYNRDQAAADVASQRSFEPKPAETGASLERGSDSQGAQPKAAPLGMGPKLSKLALGQPLGLLDGGATHALRPATGVEEYEASRPLKVGLASGETDTLRINSKGTLVTMNKDTQPILPLGVAIRVLGMSVLWRESRCDIVHPTRGRIRVTLEKGCPEVPRALCLALIDELEEESCRQMGSVAAVNIVDGVRSVSLTTRLQEVLAAGNPLGSLAAWVHEAYPELPASVRSRCVPSDNALSGEGLGFNRHTRRKVERGNTLLHLFSGVQAWSHDSFEYTLNVDKERGWDVLDDKIYAYLLDAVLKGNIVAILAGPPCRTWSRLRSLNDEGPPPLRSRDGPDRFGFPGLEHQYQMLVEGDTVLLFRTILLMELMQAVRMQSKEPPGFIFLEHPADPATFTTCRSIDGRGNSEEGEALLHKPPSIWAWKEVQQWLDRLSLHVARCDQGALGHAAVKPTQVATSSGSLWEFLNGRVVPLGDLWHVSRGVTMNDRIAASRSHAAWAPQLVVEVKAALRRWPTEAAEPQSEEARLARYSIVQVSKLDKLAAWKQHCDQGHLPWRKDCLACLESAAYMRPHRRQKHPVLLNMMADLAGPYQEGEDVEVQRGKYILLVVYPFPVWVKEPPPPDAPIPEDFQDEDESDAFAADGGVGAADPFHRDGPDELRVDPTLKEREAADAESKMWDTVVDTLTRPYKVLNLCFSEILPDKRPATVAAGLSRIYARIRNYGFPVYGLFTDRGGEMINSAVRVWCEARSLLRRTTAPESPASNGRVERLLALIRREARALLASASLSPKMWPHAVRHATEQRLRRGLAALSFPTRPMLPFWARVTIRARTWNDKKWSSRALSGRIAAPSCEVDDGWVVRVEGEKVFFYVSTLLYLDVQPPCEPPDLSARGRDLALSEGYSSPVHRHRSKSPVGPSADGDDPSDAIAKVPTTKLPGLAPRRRHLSKGTSALLAGARDAVGSSPVPHSFVELLSGSASSTSTGSSGSGGVPVDKTVIEADGPSLRKVVGLNPQFQAPAPVAGYYQNREHVRYCRLLPEQWEAIRGVRPGQVPGLGDLWVTLDPSMPQVLLAENPSELIPAALYVERHRDWSEHPVVTARSSTRSPVDIARVLEVQHAVTPGGGHYAVFYLDNVVVGREEILLLWIQIQVARVYEPLMPRLSRVTGSSPTVTPPPQAAGGGDPLFLSCGARGHETFFEKKQELVMPSTGLVPRLAALRAPSQLNAELESELDGEDSYVFIPQGEVGDEFWLGASVSALYYEERIARLPEGVSAPLELTPCDDASLSVHGEACGGSSLSKVDASMLDSVGEVRWYDQLPGEPMYLDDSPEDLIAAESLIEGLDAQRQAKLRVIREQEVCFQYELERGEGQGTKEWLTAAYANLGELEAQMSRLQYEQLQRTGSAPVQLTPELARLEAKEDGGSTCDVPRTPSQPEPEVLHTHSVPLSEVVRDLRAWHPALLEEFNSVLTTHRAIRPVSKEELKSLERSGREVLYVPGKLVATVKAGTGKRKARIVACGNFLNRERAQGSPTLSKGDIFAAGLDSLALRAQLAVASWRRWPGATVDIKTAFLTAPLQAKRSRRVVVLRPPRILVTAGIVPEGSLYLIEKALYGLAESPQDWGAERDRKLRSLRWNDPQNKICGLQQAKSDHSIWLVRELNEGQFVGMSKGLLGVYVDDLLLTAEEGLLSGLLEAITGLWKCSSPQTLDEEVVFCGLQIKLESSCYLLGQSKYIQELQQRHADIRASRTLPSFRDEELSEETPSLSEVREAQKYLGELQWLSCRSRPDISFSVSRASRLVAKNPRYAIKVARQILAYLFGSVDLRLRYGDLPTHPELAAELPYERSMSLVEAFSDASFGCEDGRSQSGVTVLLGGCLVAWLSVPQPFTTLSTCEAELVSACEALTLSQAILPLWQELTEVTPRWVAITDSVSAAAVLLYPAGSWRTRHLRLRCRAYQELIEEEVLTLAHVKGQYQVADLLTKALSPLRIKQLLDYLGCLGQPLASAEDGTEGKKGGTMTSSTQKGAAQSLVVLSCLLSPVEAQPVEGLRTSEGRIFCLLVLGVLLCVVICWRMSLGTGVQRLRRLQAKGDDTLNVEPVASSGKETRSTETLEPWEMEEVEVGEGPPSPKPTSCTMKARPKIGALPAIPEARSTVGMPPSLSGVSAPKSKNGFRKAPPPILHPAGPSVKANMTASNYPVKRPPLLPVRRFYGPSSNVATGENPKAKGAPMSVNSPEEDSMVVHTPPRQQSSELPPLLTYVELIQRAMRRELNREPTQEEVEEEIRQMGIRNAISALEGSSGSDGSEWSSDSESSGEIPRQHQQTASSSSSFTYLPPEPTPIVRLVAPEEGEPRGGDVIWEAELVDGDRTVPTTVIAHERPSGSSEPQRWYVDDAIDGSRPGIGTCSGATEAARLRELSTPQDSSAVVLDGEGYTWLPPDGSSSNVGEPFLEEVVDLDHQLAAATLFLHQHTGFEVPVSLEHLSPQQVRLYHRLLARWRDSQSEVD